MQGESFALEDVAQRLERQLMDAGVGRRPLIFICHSMGGLVVKEMLMQGWLRRNEGGNGKGEEGHVPASHHSIASRDKGHLPSSSSLLNSAPQDQDKGSSIFESVKAVVFFSTPHFGSSLAGERSISRF